MRLTAADVRNVRFGRPPLGRRGYHEREVDEFLDAVAATLAGTGDVRPAEVRQIAFHRPPLSHRGYNEEEVDRFLDEVEAELVAQLEQEYSDGGQ